MKPAISIYTFVLRQAGGKNDSIRRSRFSHGPLTFSYAVWFYCSLHVTFLTKITHREWLSYLRLFVLSTQAANYIWKGVGSRIKALYLHTCYLLKNRSRENLHIKNSQANWNTDHDWKKAKRNSGRKKNQKRHEWYESKIRGGRKMLTTTVYQQQ